ncbi:MAG: hypothetical protein CVU46_07465 [Chloroflexi bacterium HGW-Chloroflexi-8]|jgi:hypothetical protein|nr:MAG: hypothetical protein CVU46_07465 [Chloroflexi bacterium HGW-Chloroflexi-8]
MNPSIFLNPMVCPNCAMPILANVDEVAWMCSQCQRGVLLNSDNGLSQIEIHFQQSSQDIEIGFPYWVTIANVTLNRETLRGNMTKEMLQFWQNPRTVFIPAFELEMEEMLIRAETLIKNPPALFAGEAINFKPVILSPWDLRVYIEFLVMQIEAERQDDLKQLTFELQLSDPVLWIFPG